MINRDIIDRLKEAREAKGLSQRALAARAGLPQSHISKIEQGAVDLQLSSLTELARVLDLEVKLVPRHALPAIDSIVRQTAPSIERSRQAQTREALRRAAAVAAHLARFDEKPEIDAIRESAHILQNLPLPAQDYHAIEKAVEPLYHLEKVSLDTNYPEDIKAILDTPKIRKALRDAARCLQTIRNRTVHNVAPPQPASRPAYQLDEDEGDG